ncbi:MAG TPA: hypothetical protein PLO37_22990 [Candidatus Hydrogenedentes bacterium]|nr:hypothetical protein [Candidatus Hydrogenedentota bacterium]HPG69725.1 hypothetical protein [Candidatus Hydrogenedentota bacterium]
MKKESQQITKVCESWWAKLADSTKVEQHHFAAELLRLLGWAEPEPMQIKPEWTQTANASYILRGGAQTAIAAYFVMPGALDPPASLAERGLDFCDTTRLLVNAARAVNASYAFITDLYRSYLYDVTADELLLCANAPVEFERDFVGVLARADVERGGLEEVRRQPRSFVARQLREWCQHWCGQLCSLGRTMNEDTAALVMDRLLVLRFLFYHDVLKRANWRFAQHFASLVSLSFRREPKGCGAQLVGLFRKLHREWNAQLFSPDPAIEDVLGKDEIAAPLLREFALLSRTKFTIATILESFNYGEPAEKARVRMVPDTDTERETQISKWTLNNIDEARLEIDVKDEGYRAIFYWFDKLVALYDRLDIEFDHEVAEEPVPEDIDLFAWAEKDAARPRALADKYQHAVEGGLVLYYASSRQFRTARLLLYLHLISRYHQTQEHFAQFPDLAATFRPRPNALESDRKWLRDAAGGAASEVV